MDYLVGFMRFYVVIVCLNEKFCFAKEDGPVYRVFDDF